MVIAIDGLAGSGKTTTAKYAAEKLGFIHINTGAMYRGIAFKCINKSIDPYNTSEMECMLNQTLFEISGHNESELYMDGKNISSNICLSEVTQSVSRISAIPIVRKKLVYYQRKMAKNKDVVIEGRDIGTVVFPTADYTLIVFKIQRFYLITKL